MKRKLALLLVVLIVLACQLSAADHYAYGTPLGMRILVDPAAVSYDGMYGNRHGSLASIGYDFSANYMAPGAKGTGDTPGASDHAKGHREDDDEDGACVI